MKQYDSYLIFGCHFSKKSVELITANSTLKYFNNKIKNVYNCEIIEATIPVTDNQSFKQYYLKIMIEQSDPSILKVDKLKEIDIEKYKQILDIFEMEFIDPYLISVPIIRELPNYQ